MTIGFILICLLFTGFFSGMEIAFVSANRLKLAINENNGLSNRIVSRFSEKPSLFIGTLLVGNNIALVLFGLLMARNLEPVIRHILPDDFNSDFLILLFQTIISTLIVLIIGEFIPKVLFRFNSNKLLNFFAIPMQGIFYLLYPLVIGITWMSKQFLEIFLQTRITEEAPSITKYDLEHFVKESEEASNEEQDFNAEFFENALYLPQVRVRECMVPRTEIMAIEVHASISTLRQSFINSEVSRLLVYDDTIDNILGYVHHHSLWQKPRRIKSILFSLPLIPETMTAADLLNLFISRKKSIAWVVDEFGGTAGVITLEDILEEIFGEIEDEHDKSELIEQKIAEGIYIFSARTEIDYINETYQLNLPQGEYETLGGLILDSCESIPHEKETIRINEFQFTILKANETHIDTVKLKILNNDSF